MLTDEELTDAKRRAAMWLLRDDNTFATRENAVNEELLALDVVALVDEARNRRARDLLPSDLEALRAFRECFGGEHYSDVWSNALAALDRLLGGQEGK